MDGTARGIRTILLTGLVLVVGGCESAYYGAWEQLGVHKRDILVDRVEEASEAQEAAKEQFQSALEQFASVVDIPPSDLKDTYEDLAEAFEDSESRAQEVSERIDAVESVSEALFEEWGDLGDREAKVSVHQCVTFRRFGYLVVCTPSFKT